MFPAVHEIDGLPLTVSVASCIHGVLRFGDSGLTAFPLIKFREQCRLARLPEYAWLPMAVRFFFLFSDIA